MFMRNQITICVFAKNFPYSCLTMSGTMLPGITTHAIFDYGGTIIDISCLRNALVEYAGTYGKELPSSILDKLGEIDCYDPYLIEVLEYLGLNEESLREIKKFIFKGILKGIELKTGAEKLIRHLIQNNIPTAIATNLSSTDLKSLIKATKVIKETDFSHFVCAKDDPEVTANKPDPSVYLVCFNRFQPKPKSLDSCVIFEDSLRGITGAVASGMKTVLINDGKHNDLSETGKITVIVDSFDNFKPESIGLPAFP